MKRRVLLIQLLVLALSIFAIFFCNTLDAVVREGGEVSANGPRYVPGEIIVKFKPVEESKIESLRCLSKKYGFTKEIKSSFLKLSKNNLISRLNSRSVMRLMGKYNVDRYEKVFKFPSIEQFVSKENSFSVARKGLELNGVYKIKIKGGIESAWKEFSGNPNVEYAELNYMYSIADFPNGPPNDPYYHSSGTWGQGYDDLWGIKRIDCEGAWPISTGRDVVVAVVDSGVDYNHPDLSANIWTGANGEHGYDFVNNDNDPIDDNGHGTHCAGTIAAVADNGEGVIGVAPGAKIMAVKGLDAYGWGTSEWLANALKYAADNNAKVISNSWGGAGRALLIEDAVEYAYQKGAVIVAAAGNDNLDVSNFHPAHNPRVISVSAFDQNDRKAYFSNYGIKIDVAAPGVDILSLRADGTARGQPVGDDYTRLSGTSMACPHVSGVAALILAKHPEFTNEEVRQIIMVTAMDVSSPGWDKYSGYGMVNAKDACSADTPPCSAKILYPVSYSKARGVIDIKGTAGGTGFLSYTLALAPYQENFSFDNSEIIFTSNSPSNGILLQQWDTAEFRDGDYLLFLTVESESGVVSRDIVRFTIQNCEITLPVKGECIRAGDSITIKGYAGATNFRNYTIEYRKSNEDEYHTDGIQLVNGGRYPVETGEILGIWDTSSITEVNFYKLRLSVDTGAFINTYEIEVFLDPTLHPGWPKMIKPFIANGGMYAIIQSPTVADIDNDGTNEILISYGNNITVYRHDGSIMEGWPQYFDGEKAFSHRSPLVGDVDGNGQKEIILSPDSDWGRIYIWNHDGTRFQGWPKEIGEVEVISDINYDGKMEIIAKNQINISGNNGERLHVVDIDGNYLSGWPIFISGAIYKVSVGNIDNRGDKEIIVSSLDGIYIYKSDGGLLRNWQIELDLYTGISRLGDLDKDGYLEIVIVSKYMDKSIYIYEYTGNLKFRIELDSAPNAPVLGDVDCDGDLEIVVGTDNNYLYVFNHDGTILNNNWPVRRSYRRDYYWSSHGFGQAVLADIDNDDEIEILADCNFSNYYYPQPYLPAFNLDGSMVFGFPKLVRGIGASNDNSPIICDLDNDGLLEVIWICMLPQYGGYYIYVWDLPARHNPELMEWTHLNFNPQHTNCYAKPNKPPHVTSINISPDCVFQGDTVSFSGTGADIDGAIVGYSWRSSIDGYLSDSATFSTSSLSCGTHAVYLKVKDNDGAWSGEVFRKLAVRQSGCIYGNVYIYWYWNSCPVPFRNAQVLLKGTTAQGERIVRETSTDRNGYYSIDRLPEGDYAITIVGYWQDYYKSTKRVVLNSPYQRVDFYFQRGRYYKEPIKELPNRGRS